MVLGKELRREPRRALRELRARSAGAAAAHRAGAARILCLEAPFVGQERSGSQIVADCLAELGVPPVVLHRAEQTHSTRAEALAGCRLAASLGVRSLLVLTHDYHVDRARRYFEEAAAGRLAVAVHTPAALLRLASPMERAWIREAQVDDAAMQREARVERTFGLLATLLRPLPTALRHGLEVEAGKLLRAASDRRQG